MPDGQLSNYVAAVEAENEMLRERVRQLEEAMGIRLEIPPLFGLTGYESQLLGLLMKRELVTKEFAIESLYANRPNEIPELKIIDVYVCKMRKKLKGFGIEIITIWGRGYCLNVASKQKLAEYLGEALAA